MWRIKRVSAIFSRGCGVGVWPMQSAAGERGAGYHRKIIKQKDIVPLPPLHFFCIAFIKWRKARYLKERMEFVLEKRKKGRSYNVDWSISANNISWVISFSLIRPQLHSSGSQPRLYFPCCSCFFFVFYPEHGSCLHFNIFFFFNFKVNKP